MGILEALKQAIIEITTYSGQDMIETAMTAMTFGNTVDAPILEGLLSVTGPIGITLMVVYFMTGIFRDISMERDSDVHVFVKAGIVLLVADLLLMQAGPIIGALASLSNSIMGEMNTAIITSRDEVNDALNQMISLDGMSVISLVLMLLPCLLGNILSVVASAIVFIVCASAKIELMLRFAFAPIGFASVAEGGTRNIEAMRYLKKLVASAFYCGAVLVALYIANSFGKDQIAAPSLDKGALVFAIGFLSNWIYTIALPFAAIGVLSTAKAMISEAFGA